MRIKVEQLKKILKNEHSEDFYVKWAELFSSFFPAYRVDSPRRAAAFIAQCAHESAEFTQLSENLNYSAKALARVWPSKFASPSNTPNPLALQIARSPCEIANTVYAGRYGNGNYASGDGWKYRGRGLIQLTFKDNYAQIGKIINRDIVSNPDYVGNDLGALEAALGYWKMKGLNELADTNGIADETKRINSAMLGLQDRQEYFDRALIALGGTT